jgi:hypothetical protein
MHQGSLPRNLSRRNGWFLARSWQVPPPPRTPPSLPTSRAGAPAFKKESLFSSPPFSWLEQAKASAAQSRDQAQAYQARQRQLQAQAGEISSQEIEREPLIQRGGFKLFLEA